MNLALLLTSSLCLATAASGIAQTADSLKRDFRQESQLLEEAIDDYGLDRAHEREKIQALRQLSERLDGALADPNVSLDYLTDLETQLTAARDRACSSLERTAEARRNMYDHMESLAAVAREFESQTQLFDRAQEGLSGMWHLEVQPLDVYGLINLRIQGSQVSGPYRLSNGRQGSVRGSLAGNSLHLQAIDEERGVIANIEARVDPAAGEIRGIWTALELASGLPSTGDWLADRVSSQEEIDLDY